MQRKILKKKRFAIRLGGVLHRARFSTLEAGRAWQIKMREDFERSLVGLPVRTEFHALTIEQAIDLFLETRKHQATYRHDVYRFRTYVIPPFRGRHLHTIKRDEWRRIFGDGERKVVGSLVREHGLSNATSNRIKSITAKLYKWARLEMEAAIENPVADLKELPEDTKPIEYLPTMEKMIRFVEAASRDRIYPQQIYIFAMLALNTGARMMNIAGLRWDDVDFDSGTITYQWKWDYTNKRFIPGVKGKDGGRYVVGMNDTLRDALLEYRAKCDFKLQTDFVCSISRGRTLSPKQIELGVQRACEVAGLPRTHPHALRHTFATHAVESGIHQLELKAAMNHASLATTERYVHENRERKKAVANKLQVGIPKSSNVLSLSKKRR